MKTSAPTSTSCRRAVLPFGVGVVGDPLAVLVGVGLAAVDGPGPGAGDDVAGPLGVQQLDDRVPGRTGAADHDLHRGHVLAHDPQRVDQGGEHDDGGAVLVVVEDGDVELVAEPPFDLEAARGGDVLQVDPAVHRRERLDDGDDLLGVGGVEADRPGVDVGEPLEQRGLALHHRQRGGGTDVTQTQHRGSVGDHGHGVALDRQPAGVGGVGGDRQAHPGHARGVRPGEVVPVAQLDLGLHRQLPAQVHQEGAVADLADLHPVQRVDRRGRPAPRGPRRRCCR